MLLRLIVISVIVAGLIVVVFKGEAHGQQSLSAQPPPWVPTERCSREYPVYTPGAANTAESVCGSVRWVPYGTSSGPIPIRLISHRNAVGMIGRGPEYLADRPGRTLTITVLEVQRDVGAQIAAYIQTEEDKRPPMRLYSSDPTYDGPQSREEYRLARPRHDEEGIYLRLRISQAMGERDVTSAPGTIFAAREAVSVMAADGRSGRWVDEQYVPGVPIRQKVEGAQVEGFVGALVPTGSPPVLVVRAHPNDWVYFELQP